MIISALIPTYNRKTAVLRAIDSVLGQTVPVHEVIVVDDGSTDGTTEVIRSRYGSRVALLRQANAGVSAARNRGIRESHGDWIAFLDSDDVWLPAKIERQREAITALGSGFGLCFTNCAYDANPERKQSVFEEAGLIGTPAFGALAEPACYILAHREPFWTQSLLVRRSLLEDTRFDEDLVLREDTDLLFRLCFKTRFCFVAEPLVRVDRNPSRTDGLCDLYARRDERVFLCLERLYAGWLTMPEVVGTEYEPLIRNLLRLACYDSVEHKLHRLRVGPALRELVRLKRIGDSYTSTLRMLLSRRFAKLRRSTGRPLGAGSFPIRGTGADY